MVEQFKISSESIEALAEYCKYIKKEVFSNMGIPKTDNENKKDPLVEAIKFSLMSAKKGKMSDNK